MLDKDISESHETSKPSVADELIFLANLEYEVIRTQENDFLAVPLSGPKIVKPLLGMGNTLADDLMRKYRETCRKLPSERAVRDAVRVLISEASAKNPVQVYIRFAQIGSEIFVDLGDETGQAIQVSRGTWRIIDNPPVVFRRTALTAPFPRPKEGGDFSKLFSIINIPKEQEGLVLGFIISAYFESIPHPIIGLNGEQGSGKSGTAKRLVSLIDPSPAALQSPPKDLMAWIELAAGSYAISLDNLSKLNDWLSDSLCRASTGDSLVKRQHYSDKDLVVHKFKRVIILNGINLTILRDDLADRIIPISLPVITSHDRKYEADLEDDWANAFSEIFGGILTLCAKVLEGYEMVELAELPRMADFARILKAIDMVRGTDSLSAYLEEIGKMASNAIDGDNFLKVLRKLIPTSWTGTAAELLDLVSPAMPLGLDKTWPTSAREVTEKLTRTSPTLRKVGWNIEDLGSSNENKTKRWRIAPPTGVTGEIFTLYTKSKGGEDSAAS